MSLRLLPADVFRVIASFCGFDSLVALWHTLDHRIQKLLAVPFIVDHLEIPAPLSAQRYMYLSLISNMGPINHLSIARDALFSPSEHQCLSSLSPTSLDLHTASFLHFVAIRAQSAGFARTGAFPKAAKAASSPPISLPLSTLFPRLETLRFKCPTPTLTISAPTPPNRDLLEETKALFSSLPPHLKSLSFSGLPSYSFTEDDWSDIIQRIPPTLESIKLAAVPVDGFFPIAPLLLHLPQLHTLKIIGTASQASLDFLFLLFVQEGDPKYSKLLPKFPKSLTHFELRPAHFNPFQILPCLQECVELKTLLFGFEKVGDQPPRATIPSAEMRSLDLASVLPSTSLTRLRLPTNILANTMRIVISSFPRYLTRLELGLLPTCVDCADHCLLQLLLPLVHLNTFTINIGSVALQNSHPWKHLPQSITWLGIYGCAPFFNLDQTLAIPNLDKLHTFETDNMDETSELEWKERYPNCKFLKLPPYV